MMPNIATDISPSSESPRDLVASEVFGRACLCHSAMLPQRCSTNRSGWEYFERHVDVCRLEAGRTGAMRKGVCADGFGVGGLCDS
jgi:hypothetical protein